MTIKLPEDRLALISVLSDEARRIDTVLTEAQYLRYDGLKMLTEKRRAIARMIAEYENDHDRFPDEGM